MLGKRAKRLRCIFMMLVIEGMALSLRKSN